MRRVQKEEREGFHKELVSEERFKGQVQGRETKSIKVTSTGTSLAPSTRDVPNRIFSVSELSQPGIGGCDSISGEGQGKKGSRVLVLRTTSNFLQQRRWFERSDERGNWKGIIEIPVYEIG